jgi:hypothetical protein
MIMTEERRKLIDRFQRWLDTNPRKQIIAAECANIAEKYADEQLRLHNVSQQRELLKDFLQYVNCSNTDSKVSFDLLDKYLNSL